MQVRLKWDFRGRTNRGFTFLYMYTHVCTWFRHVCTVLPNPVQVVRCLTKDMRWASNILWYIARQSSSLLTPTERTTLRSEVSFQFNLQFCFRAIPKERFRPSPAAAVVLNQLSVTGNYLFISAVPSSSTWHEIQIHLILIPKSLDGRGLIRVKECILKPQTFVLWTPRKEHTKSNFRLEHLAPCRF